MANNSKHSVKTEKEDVMIIIEFYLDSADDKYLRKQRVRGVVVGKGTCSVPRLKLFKRAVRKKIHKVLAGFSDVVFSSLCRDMTGHSAPFIRIWSADGKEIEMVREYLARNLLINIEVAVLRFEGYTPAGESFRE